MSSMARDTSPARPDRFALMLALALSAIAALFAPYAQAAAPNFTCTTGSIGGCTCQGSVDCRDMRRSGLCTGPMTCKDGKCSCFATKTSGPGTKGANSTPAGSKLQTSK